MIDPLFRWQIPARRAVTGECIEAGRSFGATERVLALLASRGVGDPDAIRAFFGRAEDGLHDPWLLPDARAVVARVAAAVERRERVLVFGDFDADGLTGLSILVLALRRLGLDAAPYVPERLDEGHGLSLRAIDRAEGEGRTLIVTADCGTTSAAEIENARARGVETIVTDHHHAATWPRAAVAVVNPQRPDSDYPERRLTGAGVAWKVAQLLAGALSEGVAGRGADSAVAGSRAPDPSDLADLALVGTVADVAPVFGENRSIARLGLARLRTAPRPGIAALLATGGMGAASLDLESIAFGVAPRLNAAGRVGEAGRAARLLLSEDPEEAAALAAELEAANASRREMTKTAVDEARSLLGLTDDSAKAASPEPGQVPAAILVRGEWPVGIVGLVAGRLAEDHGRPVVVATPVDGGAVLRASCRSPKGFDLAAALTELGDLFVRHGGHAAAAGFEIEADRWPAFERRFLALADGAALPSGPPQLWLDLVMAAADVDYALVREFALLEPFGPGHAAPLLGIAGLTVHRVRAAQGGHTQLVLKRTRDVLDAIAFRRPDLVGGLAEGDRIDVVARVASRAFGGYESLQLEVLDVAPAGTRIDATRAPRESQAVASAPHPAATGGRA